jgi:hypothetical protein
MAEEKRRQNKRYNVNWSSRLLFADKRIVSARVRDVSSGGVGFEYAIQIPNGTEVSVEFSPMVVGKKYLVRAKGLIMFSVIMSGNLGFSHGLKFTLISRDQFAQLAEILESFG